MKIKNKKYYTAHGCIFLSQGKKKIGKESLVFKKERTTRVISMKKQFILLLISIAVMLALVLPKPMGTI